MRTKIWLGLAAATALVALAPTGAANAQSLGQNLFQKMFGTGDDAPPINYSDRAPLVKPGKLDLPPPGTATNSSNDPNWPVDPDEKKRKASGIFPRNKPEHGDNRLPSDEMAVRTPGAGRVDAPEPFDAAKASSVPLKPSELQKRLNLGEDTTPLVAGQEPRRRSLTDPPTGYRKPLASAPVGGDEPLPSEADKNDTWFNRTFRPQKVK
ncbi:hypothetical protein [Labrys neptuniae]